MTSTTVLKDRDNVVWDLAFLPDGTMFFTERCGGLSVRQPSGTVIPLLGIKDSKGFPQVASDLFCSGQAGMAGVAIDPDFATNRFIYVYSASSMTAPGNNRVLRLTVSPDLRSVSNRQDIVTDIAYKPAKSDHPFGDPGAHIGGRLRFGPSDGFLYVTTGDIHSGAAPQSPTMIGGKVLRIDREGRAAPGNNPPQGFDPRVFTYGHRNPQGICFRPGTNQPFTSENGPWHSDEVTALVAGGNAGWDPRPNVNGRGPLPGQLLRLLAKPNGRDAPCRAVGLHADDRHEGLPECDEASLEQRWAVSGDDGMHLLERSSMEGLERQDGGDLHGHRYPRNAGGQPPRCAQHQRGWSVCLPHDGGASDAGGSLPFCCAGSGREHVRVNRYG